MREISLSFRSRRSPLLSQWAMAATSQPLAVQIGLQLLQAGGSAADAAVAMAAALNVTEPTSTGIGGDCFVLYYRASEGKVYALNGSGRAPRRLTLDLLRERGFGEALPPFHALTVTVPGAAAAWCDLVERFGRLDMSQVLAPAIELAQEGFPVSPITAYFWARGVQRQLAHALNGQELTLNGRAPAAGEIFHNPGLARTLRAVADGGAQAFYSGEIAHAVVQVVQQAGGVLEMEDLNAHRSEWVEPISTLYRGLRIWECPPNGQGLIALLALNILEGYDFKGLAPFSARRLHLLIEALRLAFADGARFVADPRFAAAPLQELLSPAYAARRRELIDLERANPLAAPGLPAPGDDTVYLTVVDAGGDACSLINSNYMGFGTGLVPKGWGFTLQNRGHNFSLQPGHPNAVAPGKRPYHTIIPAMATWPSGQLYASFGVMGGFMQPQGQVQVLMALLDDQLDPQTALDRPRICLEGGLPEGPVALEVGIPAATAHKLESLGHQVRFVQGHGRALFGRGQIILRHPDSGVLWGGSDPRADGCAMGLASWG